MKYSGSFVCIGACRRVIIFVAVITFLFPVFAANAYVELDPDFGTGGVVSRDFTPEDDRAKTCFLDEQGRIVVVGSYGGMPLIARFNSDGTYDGYVTGVFPEEDFSGCIDSSGQIFVTGSVDGDTVPGGTTTSNWNFALKGYDQDFGGSEQQEKDFEGRGDYCYACAVTSDDKVIMVGEAGISGTDTDFGLVIYDFADAGDPLQNSVTTDLGWGNEQAYAVAVDNEGRIVVGGKSENGFPSSECDFALARYNSDGSIDDTFGSGGIVSTDFNGNQDVITSVAIDHEDKIVAAGYAKTEAGTNINFALARYNTDGTLDTTFGEDGTGKVFTHIDSTSDYIHSCVIDRQGRIVVAGKTGTASAADFVLARYTSDGNLDPDFNPDGDGGYLLENISSNEGANSCLIDEQGRIVVAGYSDGPGADNRVVILRYLTDYSDLPTGDDDDDFVPPVTDDDDDVITTPDDEEIETEDDELPEGDSGCSMISLSGIMAILVVPLLLLLKK